MKSTDIQKLKAKTIMELEKDLIHNENLLRSSKFDMASGKIKNLSLIRTIKKDIARIKTFLNINSNGKK
ncbi:MAG: 50S ribosomal protein L29 [Candidatus Colwellbacteria bacterium]|nr:50S ribosomal protein L29 [Candidatus Colwellbacteria bacterium]MBI3273983.1 50S ribosomal protein L29 [Candidatus Colwellbacteria bacterium]